MLRIDLVWGSGRCSRYCSINGNHNKTTCKIRSYVYTNAWHTAHLRLSGEITNKSQYTRRKLMFMFMVVFVITISILHASRREWPVCRCQNEALNEPRWFAMHVYARCLLPQLQAHSDPVMHSRICARDYYSYNVVSFFYCAFPATGFEAGMLGGPMPVFTLLASLLSTPVSSEPLFLSFSALLAASFCACRRASLSLRSFSFRRALDSNSCQSPSSFESLMGS